MKPKFIEVRSGKESSTEIIRDDFEFSGTIIKNEQKRKNWIHIVTHSIAYLIVGTFVVVILYNVAFRPNEPWLIPDYFISIVSIVIGFYFGGKLAGKSS